MKQQTLEVTIPAQQVFWIMVDNNNEYWLKVASIIPNGATSGGVSATVAAQGKYSGNIPTSPLPPLTGWLDGNSYPLPSTGSGSPSPMDVTPQYILQYVNEFERTVEIDNSGDYTITDQYINQWARLTRFWLRTP